MRAAAPAVRPPIQWRPVVLRAFAAVVVEVTLYYALPFDREVTWRTLLWLVLGLAAFCAVLGAQIRKIVTSPYPRLRAVVAIMVSLPVFLLLFATTYFLVARSSGGAFTEQLSRTDALYFSVTIFSTVGFGDITPTAPSTRVLVMFQMIGDLLLVGLIGRVLVGAVGKGLELQSGVARGAGVAVSSGTDDER
jgi:voltage-gated potassium channel